MPDNLHRNTGMETSRKGRLRKSLVEQACEEPMDKTEPPGREISYGALQSGNARFDGLIFVGVSSAGVYKFARQYSDKEWEKEASAYW